MTIVIMLLAPNTSRNVTKSPPLASLKLQVSQVFYLSKTPSGDLEWAPNSHFSVVYSFEVMLTCMCVPSLSSPPSSLPHPHSSPMLIGHLPLWCGKAETFTIKSTFGELDPNPSQVTQDIFSCPKSLDYK